MNPIRNWNLELHALDDSALCVEKNCMNPIRNWNIYIACVVYFPRLRDSKLHEPYKELKLISNEYALNVSDSNSVILHEPYKELKLMWQ